MIAKTFFNSLFKHKLFLISSILWFSYYLFHTLIRHHSFNSYTFDLGIYNQAIYLYTQTLLPISSINNLFMISDHIEPVLAMISILFQIVPRNDLLLIIQAISLLISMLILYRIGLHLTNNSTISVIGINVYAASTGIFFALNYDFHTATISIAPLSLLLYALFKDKKWLAFISAIAALLLKEDMFVIIILIATYALLFKKRSLGLVLLLISLLYAIIIFNLIVPFANTIEGKAGLVSNRFMIDKKLINPLYWHEIETWQLSTRANTFLNIFKDYGFIPLLSPLGIIVAIPHMGARFISAYPGAWTYFAHYNAPIEPILVVGLWQIWTIARNKRIPIIYINFSLILLTCINFVSYSINYSNGYIHRYFETEYIRESIADNIYIQSNRSLKLSVQADILPHFADRNSVVFFPRIEDSEYIILDESLSSANWYKDEEKTGMLTKETYIKFIDNISSDSWEIIEQNKSFKIYKKTTINEKNN